MINPFKKDDKKPSIAADHYYHCKKMLSLVRYKMSLIPTHRRKHFESMIKYVEYYEADQIKSLWDFYESPEEYRERWNNVKDMATWKRMQNAQTGKPIYTISPKDFEKLEVSPLTKGNL